jgi:hypothetical protein
MLRYRSAVWQLATLVFLLVLPGNASAQFEMDASPSGGRFRIFPRGDTIWFAYWPSLYTQPETQRAIGYVRGTNAWIEGTVTIPPVEDAVTHADSTVVRKLNNGLELLHLRDTIVEWGQYYPAPLYGLRDPRTRVTVPLLIPDTRANRLRVFSAEDTLWDTFDTFSTAFSAFVETPEHVWFGMWAGIPQVGDRAYYRQRPPPDWVGGVLQYDVANARVTPLLHPWLRNHLVSDVAVTQGALWIGTERFDGDFEESEVGLLRYDLRDSTWRNFPGNSSPLPGNTVTDLHAVGDILFISADSGVAVLNTTNGTWNVRWEYPVIRNDSVVITFRDARPGPDIPRDATIEIANILNESRLSALLDAMRRSPRATQDSFVSCGDACDSTEDGDRLPRDIASVISYPAFLPFLERAFNDTTPYFSGRSVATLALANMKHPRARAILHSAFDKADITHASLVASLLLPARDARARAWLRSQLARAIAMPAMDRNEVEDLVRAVRESADSASVAVLLDVVRARADTSAMRGVMELGTIPQQRALARLAETRAMMWVAYLDEFDNAPYGDDPIAIESMKDPAIRASVTRIARTALLRADTALVRGGVPADWQLDHLHRLATVLLARYPGNPSDAALLTRLFLDPKVDAFFLAKSLVLLTGESDSPKADRMDPTPAQRRELDAFWRKWWQQNGARFRIDPDMTKREEAVTRWLTRHNLPLCC